VIDRHDHYREVLPKVAECVLWSTEAHDLELDLEWDADQRGEYSSDSAPHQRSVGDDSDLDLPDSGAESNDETLVRLKQDLEGDKTVVRTAAQRGLPGGDFEGRITRLERRMMETAHNFVELHEDLTESWNRIKHDINTVKQSMYMAFKSAARDFTELEEHQKVHCELIHRICEKVGIDVSEEDEESEMRKNMSEAEKAEHDQVDTELEQELKEIHDRVKGSNNVLAALQAVVDANSAIDRASQKSKAIRAKYAAQGSSLGDTSPASTAPIGEESEPATESGLPDGAVS